MFITRSFLNKPPAAHLFSESASWRTQPGTRAHSGSDPSCNSVSVSDLVFEQSPCPALPLFHPPHPLCAFRLGFRPGPWDGLSSADCQAAQDPVWWLRICIASQLPAFPQATPSLRSHVLHAEHVPEPRQDMASSLHEQCALFTTGLSLCNKQDTPSTSQHRGPALPKGGFGTKPTAFNHHQTLITTKPLLQQEIRLTQWDLKGDHQNSDIVLFFL